jgi:phospholipid/cholesterol/gamma-HCH transport system ATP-binding protein
MAIRPRNQALPATPAAKGERPLNRKPEEDVGPPVVQIRNLWTRFGRTVVHQDLNLDIYAGEILSIVGGSGTGKTVLLRQMLGWSGRRAAACGVRRRHQQRQPRAAAAHAQPLGHAVPAGRAVFGADGVRQHRPADARTARLPEDVIRDAVLLKMDMVGLGPGTRTRCRPTCRAG